MDLRGRGALVTGGSGDLGAAACEALARAGCDVAVGYAGNGDGALKTQRLVESSESGWPGKSRITSSAPAFASLVRMTWK